MKKAPLYLLCLFVAILYAGTAYAAFPTESGSTSGLGDDPVSRALAEEFCKCAAFNDIAADCIKHSKQEQSNKIAAKHEDLAKRFYNGSYMLAGQNFTQQCISDNDSSMRRNMGFSCDGWSKLEQQYRQRCDDTYKRLPRKLQ